MTESKALHLEPGFSFGGPLDAQISKEAFPHGSDRYWMLEALKESRRSIGISNPNPAVGCVLVDAQGNEISRGATQAFTGAHAERVAWNLVRDPKQLEGATAYVTLEPCSHFGRQPPCVDLLCHSQIRRIVIARGDPNPLVNGQGIKKLKDLGKEVQIGVLSHEASAWNFPFLANQALKRPIVALKWAQTLDGQLADDTHTSKWISGPDSRSYTHWIRQRYDAILIGSSTWLNDRPELTVRDCPLPHPSQKWAQPLPIILDPKGEALRVDGATQNALAQRMFRPGRSVLYVTTESALPSDPWVLNYPDVTVMTLEGKNLIPELIAALQTEKLNQILGHPLQSLMVEGGPKTLASFLKAGYSDLLHVFISPQFSGGKKNRIHVERLLKDAIRFRLVSQFRLGEDSVMEMVSKDAFGAVF